VMALIQAVEHVLWVHAGFFNIKLIFLASIESPGWLFWLWDISGQIEACLEILRYFTFFISWTRLPAWRRPRVSKLGPTKVEF
jgi:hypothetical protein